MNKNELMIGNLIGCDESTYKIEILGENEARLENDEGLRYSNYGEINPIVLSHEILLKSGFSYDVLSPNACNQYVLNEDDSFILEIDLRYKDKGYELMYEPNHSLGPECISMRNIKYVHELQNTFFWLGFELKIEL